MKSKVKIVRTDKGFVGYVMQNDEVIFETPPCRDGITASRALSNHIGSHPAGSSSASVTVTNATVRGTKGSSGSGRCCGR